MVRLTTIHLWCLISFTRGYVVTFSPCNFGASFFKGQKLDGVFYPLFTVLMGMGLLQRCQSTKAIPHTENENAQLTKTKTFRFFWFRRRNGPIRATVT